MNNYMECFDELLSAVETDVSEKQMKNILNREEIKACFQNNTFCGDFIALCIARDHAAGINAAKDIFGTDPKEKRPESISFFLPLLSGKKRRTAQLSCRELAENVFGLTALNFRDNKMLGYDSMLYMFIVGDCIEAAEKFLDIYMLIGLPDNSLSDFIRIAAKRKKTEMIKLFTKRGFTVSEEDLEYLYDRDAEYTSILIESEIITVHYEADEFTEEDDEENLCEDIQRIKNWAIKTDIDRIEISGNVYGSQRGLPDGRFYTFEAAFCSELNDEEFIVCEKGIGNNNTYILRFDEKLENASSAPAPQLNDIFKFCKNNTADYDKIAELILSEGDSLVIPGIGFSIRTIQKGTPPEGKTCYTYYYHDDEKTMTRHAEKDKTAGLPSFRMNGRDFYMCFDLLAEVFDDIMNDKKACEYTEKIRRMLGSEIGRDEKHYLKKQIFTCLRYYASENNYSEAVKVLREYGLDHDSMQCYDSTEFVFDLLKAESNEVMSAAYSRISFRPDLNVFSIITFLIGNMLYALNDCISFMSFCSESASSILCWLAERRDRKALLEFSHMYCQIKDTDLLELALRSPDTVYDFLQNNFYWLISDNMQKEGVIKSIDEMIITLTNYNFTETGYYSFIGNAYLFFDKKDFEFILSRMPKIKYVAERTLNEIYRDEANYCSKAYDDKPGISDYFDRQFSETVRVIGNNFAIHPIIKKEIRSKLRDHCFIVTVYNLNENVLDLPKNFKLILQRNIDEDKFLHELVRSEDRHKVIAAIRHGLLNEDNVYRTIEYAVENRFYVSLKAIYKCFNFKNRK